MGNFFWGVSIDDVWNYTENERPEHEITKIVDEIRIPRGKLELFKHPSIKEFLSTQEAEEEKLEKRIEYNCNFLIDKLNETKADFVRCWFPWNFFQQNIDSKIKYTMDYLIEMLQSANKNVIGVVGNGYSRFIPKGVSLERIEEYLNKLIPACRSIVSHYKHVKIWQIENEPNWWKEHFLAGWRKGLIWFESDSEERIIKSIYDAVREERQDCKIMINLEVDRGLPDLEKYKRYCDIIGLDLYPSYAHPHNTDAKEVQIAKKVKRIAGLEVIVAETGYPSGPGIFGYSETRQAEYIYSVCKESYSCDALSGLLVWRFSDSDWRSFPPQENHFGLYDKKGKEKQSWQVFKEFTKKTS